MLFPGGEGWELWTDGGGEGFRLESQTGKARALEVAPLPSGTLLMALPLRQLAALPFRAPTGDAALLDDLALMHLERNGMNPAVDGGQLQDHFVVKQEEEEILLMPVVMPPPGEGFLPLRSPQAFDVAGRCLPLPQDGVVLWRELGRWVFAVSREGNLLFFQALSSLDLDAEAGLEMKLALTQLALQGYLGENPAAVTLWTAESSHDARPEELTAFAEGVGLELRSEPKPRPLWPDLPSRLLPADVRAERHQAKQKQQRVFMIAAAVLLYLGLVAFLGYKLVKKEKGADLAKERVVAVSGESQALVTHQEKWDELLPVVQSDFYPYELLHRVTKGVLPAEGVHLSQATFVNQLQEEEGQPTLVPLREITLVGDAANTKEIAQYNLNLNRSPLLGSFVWTTPEPTKTNQNRWRFTYTASVPQ